MSIKKTVLILLLAFGLPIVLGNVFYFLYPNFFSQSTVNHGEFIKPIIPITKTDIVGGVSAKDLQGKWSLTYYSKKCQTQCQQMLVTMKTIHLLTNDKMRRVQRVLLSQNPVNVDDDVLIATPSINFIKTLEAFPSQSLFLIDPIGNIMMYYDGKTLIPKAVLKDLDRLFKYSRIG